MRSATSKSSLLLFALLGVMGATFAALAIYACWPSLSGWWNFEQGIRTLATADDFETLVREYASDRRHEWEVNTFLHDVGSETIERSYLRACERAVARWRTAVPPTTYYREGPVGWPSLSTVFQGEGGFVEIRAYEGNDSDGAIIRVARGQFVDEPGQHASSEGAGIEKRPDHRVPRGMLRCNWER